MPPPAVTATALSRTYGSGTRAVHALNDVDLVVGAGVLTAVAGPAGAGKSTLLACLAGSDRAVTGRVVQHSVRLPPGPGGQRTRLRPARVAVVPEPSRLDPRATLARTVRREDAEGTDPDAGGAAVGRAWWHVVVTTLGLHDHLAAGVGGLTPALRQRVALAAALAGRPDVLFVDDPAPDRDPVAVADAAAGLRACAHRLGVAVVVGTREVALAALADRVVVLVDGCLVDDSDDRPARRRVPAASPARLSPPLLLQGDHAR